MLQVFASLNSKTLACKNVGTLDLWDVGIFDLIDVTRQYLLWIC